MYHVLLAVDGDHELAPGGVVEAVTTLPDAEEAVTVTLLNVFEPFEVHDEGHTVSSADLYDETALPDAVGAVRDRLQQAGVAVDTRREHGDPAAEILAAAADLGVDAIAVEGRDRSPVGKALFGSVAQAVLLDAEVSVMVATPEA